MVFFYYILVWIAFLFCFIFLFLFSFLKPKYKMSLKSRFFLYRNYYQEKADVHFHVCSYGEVKSIKELSLEFDSRITTITQTGFECAKQFCTKVNYLVFENFLPFWLKPCKVLVIFEAEYWLMLVFMAKLYQAKIILLNARIPDKSYESYKKFSFFYKKIFSYIDEVFAQSNLDKIRLENLGAQNVQIFKNIKANISIKNHKNYLKPKEKLIVFASTHKGEEELLLENFQLEGNEKLIIAPRHPERFKEVEDLLLKKKLDFVKFTSLKDQNHFFCKNVLLLDTLGELLNFYAISDVVVLGGSFIEGIGGHNPVEVAYFNNVLISGKFIHNQKVLFDEVENVYFCEDLKTLNRQIHHANLKAKIFKKNDLKLIVQTIQEGIDARKSL
ncbi:lipid IV(A) 3-deoxy-D-manno-octulosonic acid transferase [Campylobacter hepaticus]|uniref:3-deoxy-D-manno-octulosonic acid transferase n=1 Tax=Campylobacter hepaticus TaxID=1813019 RepID=A0A6A7JRT2_9BACT|nr:lipid IV(A) 3-deoxy-D-manno-octulosonic acid transferase [Campylobacter hepaticus]AXP08710.1 3-deoxy-D-manno-octulosonic acid transferase [Campylobacter hepaticus]MCZ0772558.1 lipid IV(A) 3-deoxy-D-manno-octulosonic acid transferase [Campylobacter hepaticus]MCZ0774026.1 lipid IV(A) 3-deoxy-D-manno-octulosonic acid transferase [Campylobacter hepaticus]MCZ0775278.1 lipid IV(A) 3-deoxy-D-manno-octulosonic acid transferase [Campylobacter hepaticus]MPV53743.1 3-deoxy-D-manno-octulosonic acid tra